MAAGPTTPTCTGARPRRPNTATRSRRAPRAAPNSPANDRHRCARTDRIRTRRRNRSKTPANACGWAAYRPPHPLCAGAASGLPPVVLKGPAAVGRSRKEGRPINTPMLDYSSSCSAGRRNLAGARDEEFLYWDQGDEVQKQVAEVAKALDQRSDELAVLTCPRSPVVGGRRR